MVCRPENCPYTLGTCDTTTNTCTRKNGWKGLQTYPKALATYYCTLSPDGCLGVTYVNTPHTTATTVGTNAKLPLCEGNNNKGSCVGIVATPPLMVGNSQEAIDPGTNQPVKNWGMGLTEASGVCYNLTGPTGRSIVVATTDRCGGYATCQGQSSKAEAGPCVNKDLSPGCPCVGSVGTVYPQCCGLSSYGCPSLDAACDWCASQNHPHFDLDAAAFNYVCDTAAGAGSCELKAAKPFQCMDPVAWPPGSGGGGGGGGGVTCGSNSFQCPNGSPAPEQPAIPGTGCCCNWNMKPVANTNSCA